MRPAIALGLYLFLYPVIPEYWSFRFGSLPILTASRVIFFVTLAVLFFHYIQKQSSGSKFITNIKKDGFIKLIFLFFLWRAISAIFSISPQQSFYGVLNDISLLLAAYIAFSGAILTERDCIRTAKSIYLAAITVSLIAIIEKTLGYNVVAKFTPNWVTLEPWVEAALSDKVRDTYRAQATFTHPLVLAQFCLFAVPIALYFYSQNKNFTSKVFHSLFILLIIAALVSTGSRFSILLLGLWGIAEIYKSGFSGGRNTIKALLTFTIVAGAATFGSAYIIQKKQSESAEEQSSTLARIVQLQKSISIIKEEPIFGVGLKMAPDVVGHTTASGNKSIDSYFLSILVETGVPGMFFTLAMLYKFLAKRNINPTSKNSLDKNLRMGMINLCLFSLVLSITELFPVLFCAMGIYSACIRIKKQIPHPKKP